MKTFEIHRHYQSEDWVTETIETGLTLEEAQAHCSDPETSSSTCTEPENVARTEERGPWFDGYTEEGR